MSKIQPNAATALSAFSGAGGLDIGLESAGFATAGCLEIDPIARATLRANRPSWPLLEPRDVNDAGREIRPQDIGMDAGELTLLAGGPPCQPFSKAAQWSASSRSGLADDRGQAIFGFLDLAESFQPEVILIENVAGFLQGPTSAQNAIYERFESINSRKRTNYQFFYQIVNAADYGVPQSRQRAIGIAFRDGRQPDFPEPTHAGRPNTAWDALHDLDEPNEQVDLTGWLELLPSIPEGSNYQWLTDKGGGQPIFGYRTRYWSFLLKLAKSRPAWTLAASPGPNTGPFHWNNRRLTVRERMRLQTFPDSWRLLGAERSQIRLVGNATPPLLAEVLAKNLLAALRPGTIDLQQDPALSIGRAPSQPAAAASAAPIPDRFQYLVGVHSAHKGTGLGPAPRSATAPSVLKPRTKVR